jgi:hypothetical protein
MNISLVINRFNENLDWIQKYKNLNIFIYNKGNNDLNLIGDNIFIEKRENLGREAESYFHHIVQNYDSLSDLTIFTQAYPFDNIPLFFDNLNSDLDKKKYLNYFNWYGVKISYCDENGSPCIHPILSGHPNEYNRTLKIIYEEVFNKKCPTRIEYNPNASFSVSKDLILRNSKKVYQKFLSYLVYPEQNEYDGIFKYNPYEAHIIERMWGLIFNGV